MPKLCDGGAPARCNVAYDARPPGADLTNRRLLGRISRSAEPKREDAMTMSVIKTLMFHDEPPPKLGDRRRRHDDRRRRPGGAERGRHRRRRSPRRRATSALAAQQLPTSETPRPSGLTAGRDSQRSESQQAFVRATDAFQAGDEPCRRFSSPALMRFSNRHWVSDRVQRSNRYRQEYNIVRSV